MNDTIQRITELEWANYAAMFPIAQVTPGLELALRDDVILTSSETFPAPDTTHACLLRATSETVDDLIAEVIGYFKSKGLPTTIFLSPACTPGDTAERLLKWGFIRQEQQEAWLALEELPNFVIPAAIPNIAVRQIEKNDVVRFARLFMAAFEMPIEFAPTMAQLLEPCIYLPGVYHYLAFMGEEPIGTCSLICSEHIAILGSAGVIPEQRRSGAATNLTIQAVSQAKELGADTVILQTTSGTSLERLLRISGFKKVFDRTCYDLP